MRRLPRQPTWLADDGGPRRDPQAGPAWQLPLGLVLIAAGAAGVWQWGWRGDNAAGWLRVAGFAGVALGGHLAVRVVAPALARRGALLTGLFLLCSFGWPRVRHVLRPTAEDATAFVTYGVVEGFDSNDVPERRHAAPDIIRYRWEYDGRLHDDGFPGSRSRWHEGDSIAITYRAGCAHIHEVTGHWPVVH